MRKRLKKKKSSVFSQLMASYIVFAVISIILLYLCMFAILIFIGGGELRSLAPYGLVDENGNVGDISSFENIGGWIERLDDTYHVTEVYGEKKDKISRYSVEELTEYLTTDNLVETETSASVYRGFLKAVHTEEETVYYLMKIARKALSMTYSYNVGIDAQISRVTTAVFVLFGFLFLIHCIVMSAYLSRRIKRPLQKITEGMEQVRDGDGQVRLDFEAQREFAEIRDTFNMMIEQLETEKRRKQEMEEKKNRMLLEISHDIKTPVSTIKSSANVLEEGLVKEAELQCYYQIIDQKAGRVNTLVNELFLLLKMENIDYILQKETIDLCELVRQICAEYYEEITKQGLEFQIQIPETPIYAKLDRKEFPRVVENLLGNAAKYNRTGKMTAVEVRQAEGKIEILVRDDGEAVPEELRPLLFDPFVRGDSARQSNGGTGLGLAIAGKIAEMHGGELRYIQRNSENIFFIKLDSVSKKTENV